MAGDVKVAVVSGAHDRSTAQTTNYVKSGFGTPKSCIVIQTSDTSDGTTVLAQSKISIGFSNFTNDFCISHQDEDNSAKVDCDAIKSNTKCFLLLGTDGSELSGGTAGVITDGVGLTNTLGNLGTDPFTTVIMFGGADLTADVVELGVNSSVDTAEITNVTWGADGNDKLMFFIGTDITGMDSASSGIGNSFGVCHATGTDAGGWTFVQRCMGWASDHNADPSSSATTMNTDQCLSIIKEDTTQDWSLEVTAIDHDPTDNISVTTRDTGAGSNMECFALLLDLDDRSAKVGSVDSPTTGSSWAPSVSLGFTPQYVCLGLTGLTAENNIGNAETNTGQEGISSNTGTGEETCHSWYNQDFAGTTITNNLFRSRAIDLRTSDVATVRQDHSHSSFDSGGWTYTVNTENEPTGRKWFYAAIEEAADSGNTADIPPPKATLSLEPYTPEMLQAHNVEVPPIAWWRYAIAA